MSRMATNKKWSAWFRCLLKRVDSHKKISYIIHHLKWTHAHFGALCLCHHHRQSTGSYMFRLANSSRKIIILKNIRHDKILCRHIVNYFAPCTAFDTLVILANRISTTTSSCHYCCLCQDATCLVEFQLWARKRIRQVLPDYFAVVITAKTGVW